MKNYIRNFKFYNKNNSAGHILAFIAAIFTFMFIGLGIVAGATFTVGWWMGLPLIFIVLTVAHFIVRPIASVQLNGQK